MDPERSQEILQLLVLEQKVELSELVVGSQDNDILVLIGVT